MQITARMSQLRGNTRNSIRATVAHQFYLHSLKDNEVIEYNKAMYNLVTHKFAFVCLVSGFLFY